MVIDTIKGESLAPVPEVTESFTPFGTIKASSIIPVEGDVPSSVFSSEAKG